MPKPIREIIESVEKMAAQNDDGTYINEATVVDELTGYACINQLFETDYSLKLDRNKKNCSCLETLLPVNIVKLACNLNKETNTFYTYNNKSILISMPTVYLGDIHGDFETISTTLLALVDDNEQLPTNIAYLFLGDYIDRGKASIKTLLLLFALALNNPKQILLLSGNHEMNQVTQSMLWLNDFQKSNQVKVEKLCRKIFDQLPKSALVTPKIIDAFENMLTTRTVFASHAAPFFCPETSDPTLAYILGAHVQSYSKNSLLWNSLVTNHGSEFEGEPSRNFTGLFVHTITKAALQKLGIQQAVCAHGHRNTATCQGFFQQLVSTCAKSSSTAHRGFTESATNGGVNLGYTAINGSFMRFTMNELTTLKTLLWNESEQYQAVMDRIQPETNSAVNCKLTRRVSL